MSSKSFTTVAIDGPAASGKSTVSKGVAKALDYVYVDSGALYRGVTWKALRDGIDVSQPEQLAALIQRVNIEFFVENKCVLFTIDGEDPTSQLRSEPVRERVSEVAAVPEVRAYLVKLLRQTVQFGPVVMEGRDIGTVVFPDSPFKFYLDADPEERARRRSAEIEKLEGSSDVNAVLDSLKRRDQRDSNRATAPLQIALGAKVIDSTGMEAEQVVALIADKVRRERV